MKIKFLPVSLTCQWYWISCQGVKQVKFEAMSQKYLLMGLIDKIKEESQQQWGF